MLCHPHLLVVSSCMQSSRVLQAGVERRPGVAAAAAQPISAGEAGFGQKGLFGWCRKLAKRRQVASGGHAEQDNGAEQVSLPLKAV